MLILVTPKWWPAVCMWPAGMFQVGHIMISHIKSGTVSWPLV